MPSRLATIASTVGLHARPATRFIQKVLASGYEITVGRTDGNPVNAGSVLAVMALGIRCGEQVILTADDSAAAPVLDDLVTFLETNHDAAEKYSAVM